MPASTLISVVVTVAIGAVVLVPSLILLFTLFFHGRLEPAAPDVPIPDVRPSADAHSPRLLGAFALAFLLAGTGQVVLSDSGWAHAVGITGLAAFAASTFLLATATPPEEA